MEQGAMRKEDYFEACQLIVHLKIGRENLARLVKWNPLNEGFRLALVRFDQCIRASGFEDEIDKLSSQFKKAVEEEGENHERN